MRDPRLAEIDLLMDIERHGGLLSVKSHLRGNDEAYGLDAGQFRDMVIGLLLADHICGPHRRGDTPSVSELILANERSALMSKLCAGQNIEVLLTHAGRVRLWNLRDALLRDPDIEPMGLRSKAAWERDLFLRLRWATDDEPLSVLFLDLDDFGKVNKEHGFAVGDEVLHATFSIIKNLVGARGAVYRCGGEEVGVLLPSVPLERATELAEELRATIASDVSRQAQKLGRAQTASIGTATFDRHCEQLRAVEYVDGLMRQAKREGKNRVVSKAFGD